MMYGHYSLKVNKIILTTDMHAANHCYKYIGLSNG